MTEIEQLKPGIYYDLPRTTYDSQEAINQSSLKAFIYAATPFHFRYEQDHPKDDKDFIRIGNAIDCLVATPSEFKERFPVAPETYPAEPKRKGDPIEQKPWTLQSNWCKGWWQSRVEAGLTPLTIDEHDRVLGMVGGLESHPDIPRILSSAQRQVCLIGIHPILGYRMKAMLDVLPDTNSEWIYDLKSFGFTATAAMFSEQVAKLGYHFQAAFYLELARICGIPARKFGWAVVESNEPHATAMFFLEEGDTEILTARTRYTDAMPKYMACLEADQWPAHSTDWIKVKLKPWQLAGRQEDYERLT